MLQNDKTVYYNRDLAKDATLETTFDSGLTAGREYTVEVTAVVGADKIESEPATASMTISEYLINRILVLPVCHWCDTHLLRLIQKPL